MLLLKKLIAIFILFFNSYAQAEIINLKDYFKCEWDNKNGVPCLIINKQIPNTSQISANGVKRYIITAEDIAESNAIDVNGVLEMIPGINLSQSGPKGQQTSLFTRGTGSNHTLVLLNGVPVNDQSTTQGLHDFGVDFIQTIHQVEVYSGSNGSHFGPNAIGGAINFITTGDFRNSFEVSGFNNKNNSSRGNYTLMTDSNWIFNLKGGLVNSKTDSAIQGGSEKDSSKNLSGNFNAEKWINDNIKFRANAYSRRTISEYDSSSTIEEDYTGDNLMYVAQFGFDHIKKNLKDYLTFHFHQYDRKYNEGGVIDNYLSNAFFTRSERKIQLDDRLSLGFGGEYKYDWGKFENRGSYTASTKGHAYNTGIFSNVGFKPLKNTTFSVFGRSDIHKTTGLNNTHKINITQKFKKFKIGLTHSTGLRNPTIYELYGTDSYGYSGNSNLDPEKSITKEIFSEYNIFKNLTFSLAAFKSNINDHIEYKNNQYVNDVTKTNLNQSGIESSITWKGNNQKISFVSTSLSSKKTNGDAQIRRPEKTYGLKYTKSFNTNFFGPFQLNFKHQHYGKHWDTHSSNWSTILMDSTDIINLSLAKKINDQNWSLNISNLLDEVYQRPHGYMQEGRLLRLKFKKLY